MTPPLLLRAGFAVLALTLCACPARYTYPDLLVTAPPSPAVLFHDVSVFPATGPELLEHQDVLVREGRIVSVGPTGGEVPRDARVIEGAGQTLLPGFTDSHVHLTGSAAAPWRLTFPDPKHTGEVLLRAGITSALDVGGAVEEVVELHEKEARGEWLGPRFWYAGPHLTAVDGYPGSFMRLVMGWPFSFVATSKFEDEVATPEQVEREVNRRVAAGAHVLKLPLASVPLSSPTLSQPLLDALVKAAHGHGKKVVAHIDTAEHALMAARAGVDGLVHGVHVGELTEAQAQELKQLGVTVVPTIDVFERIRRVAALEYAPTEFEKKTHPKALLDGFSPEVAKQQKLDDGLMQWIAVLDRQQQLTAVKRLYDAGVPLLVGSDAAGSAACWAGGSFLQELELMVEAGVPPADVLLGATSRAARFIVPEPDFGTIEPGKRADLVLVRGNPLADIAAAAELVIVMKAGRLFEPR